MILVFGANGFLGSALANYLSSKNEIICVVRPTADISGIKSGSGITVITAEPVTWESLIHSIKPAAIICAQWEGVSKETRDDLVIQNRNISQIRRLAQAADSSGVGTFVTFGSQAEGKEGSELIPEQPISGALSAYGKAKNLLLEELLDLFKDSKTRFLWLRIFSIYGPNDNPNTLIPQLVACKSSEQPMKITHGNRQWSYLFVDDFVAAVQNIIESKNIQGIVNIGNPVNVSIKQICEAIPEALFFLENEDFDENAGFFPDLEKLLSTGWKTQYSLTEGVKITVENMKQI